MKLILKGTGRVVDTDLYKDDQILYFSEYGNEPKMYYLKDFRVMEEILKEFEYVPEGVDLSIRELDLLGHCMRAYLGVGRPDDLMRNGFLDLMKKMEMEIDRKLRLERG